MRLCQWNWLLSSCLALLWASFGQCKSGNVYGTKFLATTPPRGWNSYDSFSWIISEQEFFENAAFVAANLSQYGFEYVVVDFLWYRKFEVNVTVWTGGHDIIDDYGRLVPDPDRWPSTKDGTGFKPIADKVHAMGLKFGIHVMRGISTEAVMKDTKICTTPRSPEGNEGCHWTAKDIVVPGTECSWMKDCFMSVNTSDVGGLTFLKSLYQQYDDWGVDFIKHDCVFGANDLSIGEISAVAEIITKIERPILYSISPGVFASTEMAEGVAPLTNMYRVTSDDWDQWLDVMFHFPVARDFAASGFIGAPGLQGRSWPDLDMLPLGWLTDAGARYGPYRSCNLTRAEQRTQVTLWAIAKSPLFFGGDLRHADQWTLDLITNPFVLEINAFSTRNHEFSSSTGGFLPKVVLLSNDATESTRWELKRISDNLWQACWSLFSGTKGVARRLQSVHSECFNWSNASQTSNEKIMATKKGVVWTTVDGRRMCLDANVSLARTVKRHDHFTFCDGSSSQVWMLSEEGSLVSKEARSRVAVSQPGQGWRIWVARGTLGQAYVAVFNLEDKEQKVFVPLKDVLVSLDLYQSAWDFLDAYVNHFAFVVSLERLTAPFLRLKLFGPSCTVLNVWDGNLGSLSGALSVVVEPHGTQLLEVYCFGDPWQDLTKYLLCALGLVSAALFVGFLATRAR